MHPCQIESALCTYWNTLETWTQDQLDKAIASLEEHDSFLLPRHEFSAQVLPMHMMDVAKRAKPSATGLDGWTDQELASLRMQAWFWFLIVCSVSSQSILSSLTAVFRRVPIPKTSSMVCLPQETRPIDLFSVLLRLHATASTRQLIPWTHRVLHPGQYASKGVFLSLCQELRGPLNCLWLGRLICMELRWTLRRCSTCYRG